MPTPQTVLVVEDDELQRRLIVRTLRDPAVAVLRQAAGGVTPAFVEALLAFCEGRLEEAAGAAERALAAEPWRWEAAVLAGDVAVAELDRARRAGDSDGVRRALGSADGRYRRATNIGRSEPAATNARS